ncbi:MAG: MATE family efflux transporter, partial [Acidimicrobiia bacterium]|nr:MATE family efflux transporter [Acidimicrobiia bacterium]
MKLRSAHDRDIARLAVPAFGTLISAPLYVLADTAIVGHLGTSELAGLALASTVLLTVHGLMIFLAYGTTSTVARLLGGDDEPAAARVSVQGLWLALALGVTLALLIGLLSRPLLRLLGGSGPELAAGNTYLTISLVGLPFLLLTLAGAGAFHGRQNTRTPLVLAVSGNIANLVIEVVLIYGLGFGIGASALATVIAQVGVGVAYARNVLGWAASIGVDLHVVWATIRRLLVAGQPLILRTLALRGSFTLSTAAAARIGVAELAAHQVAMEVWSTLALALDAVAIAGQALTGRWLGAGAATRAREAATRMIQLDVAVGVVAAVVILAARRPIAEVFSDDPAVVSATMFVLVWVALVQPVNGYAFAVDGILIGAGDFRYLGRSM